MARRRRFHDDRLGLWRRERQGLHAAVGGQQRCLAPDRQDLQRHVDHALHRRRRAGCPSGDPVDRAGPVGVLRRRDPAVLRRQLRQLLQRLDRRGLLLHDGPDPDGCHQPLPARHRDRPGADRHHDRHGPHLLREWHHRGRLRPDSRGRRQQLPRGSHHHHDHELPQRPGHARLHHPERHHRHMDRGHGRHGTVRDCDRCPVPGGASLHHLQQQQRLPEHLGPYGHLRGQRRHPNEQHRQPEHHRHCCERRAGRFPARR